MVIVFPIIVQAQIISTFIGGVPPINEACMTFDKYRNFYFSQSLSHKVYKVDTNGIKTCIAGTGIAGYNGDGISATSAQLNQPNPVLVDTFGNIYIGDAMNSRIRKIDAGTGIIHTIAYVYITKSIY
jgi:hypothetical protein